MSSAKTKQYTRRRICFSPPIRPTPPVRWSVDVSLHMDARAWCRRRDRKPQRKVNALVLDEREGIDELAVAPHHEVHVWPGRHPGHADRADDLALLHFIAGFDARRRDVVVEMRV